MDKQRPGRRPHGEAAMTSAERQRHYRARQRHKSETLASLIEKLPGDFAEIDRLLERGETERAREKLGFLRLAVKEIMNRLDLMIA